LFTIVNIPIKIELNRMIFYRFLFLLFAFVAIYPLKAQEVWSLEKCIAYAYENNLRLKSNQLGIDGAQINLQQAKDNRLPNLNGNVGYNINFAGAIDPTTYEFKSQRISNNNLGLTSQVIVYQGGQLKKQIEKSALDLRKAAVDNELIKDNISLEIASFYLGVLRAAEQLEIVKNQKKITEEEKINAEKLIDAGLKPEGDILDIESLLIQEESNISIAQNAYDLALLDLKLLIDIDPDKDIQLENPPEMDPSIDLINSYDIDEIYNVALSNQPSIESANLQKQIADKKLEIAETGKYPTLSLTGNLSSNYSSARQTLDTASIMFNGYNPIGIVGTDVNAVVNEPTFNFDLDKTPYFTQLNDNFFQYIGANLTIPIFNQFRVKNAIEAAKLEIKGEEINQKNAAQNLNKAIRQAYADALAAGKNYEANKKRIEAVKKSYDYTDKRFKLGVATVFELQTARNILVESELNAKINKYDYLFKLKILDYYLGKPIKF